MDEAEQLCDRLVVMDHGEIVAEGSPRQLIEQYSTREVVEVRFEDERPESGALRTASAERVEVLPDRVLVYTDDGDATATAIADARAAAALDARPPQHARGRLPAPHRPHAGRLTWRASSSRSRAYEHWLAQYKRVWRGHDRHEPRQPAALPGGARRRARHDRRQDAERARRRAATSTTSLPALLAAAAMQTAATESSWPVMRAIKWTRTYHAMIATPLTERDALRRPSAVRRHARARSRLPRTSR